MGEAACKDSGTDFLPGSYTWLASIFEGEPKEESKREAVSILPEVHFDLDSIYLTPDKLTVSDTDRIRYGLLYMLLPAGSWAVFIGALFASR